MKSLNNILKGVRNALLTVTDECYHYRRPPRPKKSYVVWAEDGEAAKSFEAENRKEEQQLHGTIDYYAYYEFDEKIDLIQEALHDAGIGFRLNSVQYEDETNLIHYEWEFWAV